MTLFVFILIMLSACSGSSEDGEIETIIFANAGWDSIRIHNNIAQIIIEEGFGYDTDTTIGSTPATIQGLRKGNINVYMELWTNNNKEAYEEAIDAGDIKKVSINFDDNEEGIYVPTYVIEGDKERGIEPLAPDLRTVEDLKKYPEIFKDPGDPTRGEIINAPSGWAAADLINAKFETYGLSEKFNNSMSGSDAALTASLVSAYESGEAWVGFSWSPTAETAKYDLTLLEEPPYDEAIWEETKGTKSPPNDVIVAVHKDLPEQAADVVDFLRKYETSSELTEEALTYMAENNASVEETAIWWMNEHEDLWTTWLSKDVAEKVKDGL